MIGAHALWGPSDVGSKVTGLLKVSVKKWVFFYHLVYLLAEARILFHYLSHRYKHCL